jgi:hypothetical protein
VLLTLLHHLQFNILILFAIFLRLFAPILNGLTGIALQHRFIGETLPVGSIGKEVLTSIAVPQMLLDLIFLSPKYCTAESSAKRAL